MEIEMKIGTDDIRAPEHTHRPRGIFRSDFPELSTSWPFGKSIYENPIHAADRINVPGYRYVRELFYSRSPSFIVTDKVVDGLNLLAKIIEQCRISNSNYRISKYKTESYYRVHLKMFSTLFIQRMYSRYVLYIDPWQTFKNTEI